ncbi:hypothetical protein DK846_12835 [Methanospirillum lacunae]|uniref:CAAX prenyl protease 2/Lysostaphin resistance protein A-like domain-containing protein n=2 Tax=Methanospirillum lacunae TaxID=668570 RepID=A0A2V2N5T4_9EURY|nr:hypothetical protein DK846_12835 [Methanospirillum lacunae]
MVFGYAGLYILNILLPLDWSFPFQYSNLTSRIWSLTELLLGIGAFIILAQSRFAIKNREFFTGLFLGTISGTSHYFMNDSLTDGVLTGILVLVCYTSAVLLIRTRSGKSIETFQQPPRSIAWLILFGIIISVPFATLNLTYFYFTSGLQPFSHVISAFILACNPALSEEIIFRLFPLILVFSLLRAKSSERWVCLTVVCIGVIPHSLNHLPDLFVSNPGMAISMAILTSVFFGLPLCLLQLYKGLPSACGFHWFVDMTRFLFGY